MLTSATQQSTSSGGAETSSGAPSEQSENSGGKSISMAPQGGVPCRDILDPAPHHTPADIRVLEILKRIRDSGDTEGDSPPSKKKSRSHRNASSVVRERTAHSPKSLSSSKPSVHLKHNHYQQNLRVTNFPDLVRQTRNSQLISSIKLEDFLPVNGTPRSSTTSPNLSLPIPTTNLLPTSKNGTCTTKSVPVSNTTSVVLPQTVAAVSQSTPTSWLPTLPVPTSQIKVEKPRPIQASSTNSSQVSIGIELVLPNGIRIPVSATCAPATTNIPSHTGETPNRSDMKTTLSLPSSMVLGQTKSLLTSSQSLSSAPQSSIQPTKSFLTEATTADNQESSSKSRICSCLRSKCLKLYCDCFAAGRACDGCHCRSCQNSEDTEGTTERDDRRISRDFAMRSALARNPLAFKSKIEVASGTGAKHMLGCRCKRSQCQKNYCECYLAGIRCSKRCQCLSCSNEGGGSGIVNGETKKLTNGSNNNIFAQGRPKANWMNIFTEDKEQLQRTKSNLIKNDSIYRTITATTTTPSVTINQVGQSMSAIQQPNPTSRPGQSAMNSLLLSSPMGDSSDILSCLRNVLPPGSLQPNNSLRVVTASTHSSQLSSAALNSAGAPNVTVCGVLRPVSSSQAATANQIATGPEDQKRRPDETSVTAPERTPAPIDYSDYTEEELEFMQHLLEIRNTSETKPPETSLEGKAPSSDLSQQNYSSLQPSNAQSSNSRSSSSENGSVGGLISQTDFSQARPRSLPSMRNSPSPQDYLDPVHQQKFLSLSAPASVNSMTSNREDAQSQVDDQQALVLQGDAANSSVGVPQLMHKIRYLESRVSKLMHVVFAQGNVLRNLSSRVRNQSACKCCASSSFSSIPPPLLPNDNGYDKNTTS